MSSGRCLAYWTRRWRSPLRISVSALGSTVGSFQRPLDTIQTLYQKCAWAGEIQPNKIGIIGTKFGTGAKADFAIPEKIGLWIRFQLKGSAVQPSKKRAFGLDHIDRWEAAVDLIRQEVSVRFGISKHRSFPLTILRVRRKRRFKSDNIDAVHHTKP